MLADPSQRVDMADMADTREGLSQKLQRLLRQSKPLIAVRGAKGVGKFSLAKEAAEQALQEEKGALFPFHPSEGKSYLLEQIKEIAEIAKADSLVGKKKVLLLDDFVDLSPALLNALLKLFEEPPEGVSFILIVHDGKPLLSTIASRAMHLHVGLLPDRALLDRAIEKKWITEEEKDSERAQELLSFAQGQMCWAEKFMSSEFQEKRKPLYEEISQIALEHKNDHGSARKAAVLWQSLSALEQLDKKEGFEELVRLFLTHLRREFLEKTPRSDGEYWAYLRLCLHLSNQGEAVMRGESIASSLYDLFFRVQEMLFAEKSAL